MGSIGIGGKATFATGGGTGVGDGSGKGEPGSSAKSPGGAGAIDRDWIFTDLFVALCGEGLGAITTPSLSAKLITVRLVIFFFAGSFAGRIWLASCFKSGFEFGFNPTGEFGAPRLVDEISPLRPKTMTE